MFDRFADGRWLVVATRSDGDGNARVLSSRGEMLDQFELGDGIEHVAIDDQDRIWVGWFDEGVFGNQDWTLNGGGPPPSSNGVACFASDGTRLPLPLLSEEGGFVCDCYALNVVGSDAWACPYTDFPLMRLVLGEPPKWWRSDIAGPNAVAIEGDHALLAGGYGAQANRIAIVELGPAGEGESVSVLANYALPLSRISPPSDGSGRVWDHPDLLTGRSDTLHLVYEGVWYRWRVKELLFS